MAAGLYNSAKLAFATGDIDWESADLRCLLTTSSYTVDIDAHVNVDDVTNELSGGNYVRKTLAGLDASLDTANDRVDLIANNVTWTELEAAAGTPARAIIFVQVTNDADSILVGYADITSPPTPNGGDWTIRWGDNASTAGTIFRNG